MNARRSRVLSTANCEKPVEIISLTNSFKKRKSRIERDGRTIRFGTRDVVCT